ncbi:MAG: alpha-E domain-containing protein [Pseudomonadota bacterium]
MLSRVASSIYWMSRYLERAENVARFIAVNEHLILDMGLAPDNAQWSPLVTTSGDDVDFALRYDEPSEKNVLFFLTFDEKNPNSIYSCICAARENARTVREVISSEMWEQINAMYHSVQNHRRKRRMDNLQAFYASIRTGSFLFAGLTANTMSHNEAWQFARVGRLLERADKTARLLDVKYFLLLPNPAFVDSPYDAVEWGAVLKSANAFEMYRKHYHSINYRDVARFLIFDTAFPRALTYCVNGARDSLAAITRELGVSVNAEDEMEKLVSMLQASTIDGLLGNGLHEFIDIFQFNLNVVDQAIYRAFFAR